MATDFYRRLRLGEPSAGRLSKPLPSFCFLQVINFTPLGVSEKEVGFIGFVSTVAYCAVAPFVAFLMDRVKKHFKSTLTFLCVASTVCFVWLGLLCVEVGGTDVSLKSSQQLVS